MKLFETIYKYRQIILILIYLYVMMAYVKSDDYTTMMILTAATALILCKTTKNQIEGLTSENVDENTVELTETSNELQRIIRGGKPVNVGVPLPNISPSRSKK